MTHFKYPHFCVLSATNWSSAVCHLYFSVESGSSCGPQDRSLRSWMCWEKKEQELSPFDVFARTERMTPFPLVAVFYLLSVVYDQPGSMFHTV
jgi:hypothetical protein